MILYSQNSLEDNVMTIDMTINIVLIVIGLLLFCFGIIIWIKKKIVLIHSYHWDNIAEEDKNPFCRLIGKGISTIGAGCLIAGVINLVTDSLWGEFAVVVGIFVGVGILIYTMVKYN